MNKTPEEVEAILERSIEAWLASGRKLAEGGFRVQTQNHGTCACALGTLPGFDDPRGHEGIDTASEALGFYNGLASIALGFDGALVSKNEWYRVGERLRAKYAEHVVVGYFAL